MTDDQQTLISLAIRLKLLGARNGTVELVSHWARQENQTAADLASKVQSVRAYITQQLAGGKLPHRDAC